MTQICCKPARTGFSVRPGAEKKPRQVAGLSRLRGACRLTSEPTHNEGQSQGDRRRNSAPSHHETLSREVGFCVEYPTQQHEKKPRRSGAKCEGLIRTCRLTSEPGPSPEESTTKEGAGIDGKPPMKRRAAKLVSVSNTRQDRRRIQCRTQLHCLRSEARLAVRARLVLAKAPAGAGTNR